MLALSYAGTYPGRAQAVVALASGPTSEHHAQAEEENVKRRLLRVEPEQVAIWEQRKEQEPNRAFGEMQRIIVSAYYYDRNKTAETLHYMTLDRSFEVMQLGYDPAFGSLDKFIRSRLPAIATPVLLVHGRQDAVTKDGLVEAHQLIKGSEMKLINKERSNALD
jgi:pimeloyl-ACP methyl ester carboxylesterase